MKISELLPILQSELEEKLSEAGKLITRHHPLTVLDNKITVAIGMRRSGKTSMLLQEISKLLTEGVQLNQILFVNFEDDRLTPFKQSQLRELIDTFYQQHPENHRTQCYFFFDEIQNIENWSLLIRRIFDTKKVKIYLTGSSAKLLSTEIATELRGRCFTTEVWPFSFKEVLTATSQLELLNKKSQHAKDTLHQLFINYLQQGGFPESLPLQPMHRLQLLQDYVEIVALRDIIERHQARNVTAIRYLIRYLLNNTASSFSINKFYNDLRSQGFTFTKNYLYDYIAYIEDAYLNFFVPLYSESIRKVQTNPKKIYAIDPGIAKAFSIGNLENIGRYFETCVYLDLRRQGCEIFYYLTKERYEVDFLAKHPDNSMRLYQVVWNIDDEATLAREKRALTQACEETNLPGELITPSRYFSLLTGK